MIKTFTWIIMAVVLVGVGYYVFNSDSVVKDEVAKVEDGENSNEEEVVNEPSGKKMSFGQFVKQGGSYKCTVNQYISGDYNNMTQGTTYVSDGMVRGDYSSKVENLTVDSTVIVRDGYTYSWTSMAPSMGFKVKVVEGEGNTSTATSGTYNWNADQIGDYDCDPWTVDMSKFTIPTNITFQEINK